jgi:hypothetical protein
MGRVELSDRGEAFLLYSTRIDTRREVSKVTASDRAKVLCQSKGPSLGQAFTRPFCIYWRDK